MLQSSLALLKKIKCGIFRENCLKLRTNFITADFVKRNAVNRLKIPSIITDQPGDVMVLSSCCLDSGAGAC
jgi:hypothetical protein